jgi:hypothetical protein
MAIPENFGVIEPNGERLRYAQLSILSDEYAKSVLVGTLLEKLAASVPKQLKEINGEYRSFTLQMPEAPLTVLTAVIDIQTVGWCRWLTTDARELPPPIHCY